MIWLINVEHGLSPILGNNSKFTEIKTEQQTKIEYIKIISKKHIKGKLRPSKRKKV